MPLRPRPRPTQPLAARAGLFPLPMRPLHREVGDVGIEDRIRAAEADLNAALEHAQDLAVARQQVLDALDDLRVYRNLLALKEFGIPRDDPGLPIPRQQRRRTDIPPARQPEPDPATRSPHPPSIAGAYRQALMGQQRARRR